MKRILFLSSFLLFPFSLFSQGWYWQNPLPQGNQLEEVFFIDANTGWAVGNLGTILHTTDGGSLWGQQTSGTSGGLLSIHFTDTNMGWAVGSVGTILHTTDGGNVWTQQTSGTVSSLLSVHFIDANTGWAVGWDGTVLHTTNGGSLWTPQESGTMSILTSVHFTDTDNGWIAAYVNFSGDLDTILHTTNGGNLWTAQTTGTVTEQLESIYFVDANIGWAVSITGIVLHTSDGGNLWVQQLNTTSLSSVHFSDANTGWVVGAFGAILRTTDGGIVWTPQASGTINWLNSIQFTDLNHGWAVGQFGTILLTTNGGRHWTEQTIGTTETLEAVHFIDSNNGWAVGGLVFPAAVSIILHTTDGGNLWTPQTSGTTRELSSVQFVDANAGWVVGRVGTLGRTTNGGSLWTQQAWTQNDLSSVCFTDAITGWAVGESGTILHTTNGGSLWTEQTSGTTYWLYSVHFTDANTGWVVGRSGTILHTTNGGSLWSEQISGTNSSLASVEFADADTGWIGGDSGTMLHTTNGGSLWTRQESGVTDPLNSVHFSDPKTGWAVGLGGSTIIYTTNGGTTWTQQTSGVTNTLYSVYFTDANTGWAVGQGGTIIHTVDAGTGNEPPPPTTLVSPPNGSMVSTSPTLGWNSAPGALWYTLQVSTSSYFITYAVNQADLSSASFELSGLQTDTTYYWRVSLTDSTGTSGWSETWGFITATVPHSVVLQFPLDGAIVTTDSVVLLWHQSPPDVDRYWLEGDADSLFSSPFIDSLLTDTNYTVTPLHHNNTFWWRVKAHNSFGWGEFSVVRSFFVYEKIPDPPPLLFPDSGAAGVSTSPTFSWNPSIGSESYALQVSDIPDFSNLVVNEGDIDSTSYFVSDLQNTTTYYWRLSATNDLGTSEWSEVWSFTTSVTGVEEDARIPTVYTLSQNYPNPFNPSTVIRFGLPERAHVLLEMFNILGERVVLLVDEEKDAGYHEVSLNSRELSSGIYFYRISANGFVQTRKLALLR